jgi:hypothetical protein
VIDLDFAPGAVTPWSVAADLLDPKEDWLGDPVGWVQERLGEFLWSKQVEIMEAVRDNRHVAVRSCHESGKSFSASRVACWWLDSHPPGTAFVVSTAPKWSQVRAILWREINRAHTKGRLMGRTNQTEWWIGKEIIAFGRKPSDYDTEAFQGIHAQYVLVVIDEANGVPKGLWDAAETLVANSNSRVLAIGNPDDPSSTFAEVSKPGSGWKTIRIAAEDTPNFTGEYIPPEISQQLISPLWVDERAKAWGTESPLYISKVMGEFPPYAADSCVPWGWVEQVRNEEGSHVWKPDEQRDRSVLGVDVGAGGDFTVIWHRMGNKAVRKWIDHSPDPEAVVGKIMSILRETGADTIQIDEIGIGWGVAGFLKREIREAELLADVVTVNVAEAAQDRLHFNNLRSELWWDVGRENSRLSRWDLSAVDDDTVAQLIAPKYFIRSNGLIQVEKKEEVRARIGRSTDDADALLLAFYETPREVWRAA